MVKTKSAYFVMGIFEIVCGLIILAILKKVSGSVFPDQGGAILMIYLLAYIAIIAGIIFIYCGTRIEKREQYLDSLPILETRARVLDIDKRYMEAARISFVTFETEDGKRLKLQQKGIPDYTYYEVGQLRYKGETVVSFAVERKKRF